MLGTVFVEDTLGQCQVFASDLSVGFGDVTCLQQRLFATTLPGLVGDALVGILERAEHFATVQIALKLGDIPLFTVVTAHFVKDFDKHRKQGIDLSLTDDVGFLVDVEEDTFRRDGDSFLELSAQQLIVILDLGQENIQCGTAIDSAVFQQ
ncbi:hypothetical protein D3C84_815160 [compost metagenome]